MPVIRNNSQQTTANVDVVESDGSRKTVASASCHIRPGKGMSISIDVLDDVANSEEYADDVRQTIAAYLGEEIAKAAALGVPITLPTSGV